RVDWPIIERVARATAYPGVDVRRMFQPCAVPESRTALPAVPPAPARDVILGRRSALDFNPHGMLPRETFLSMLERLQPRPASAPPWDATDWTPRVHLALFVHRVDGVTPGVYAWLRDPAVLPEWKAGMRSEFLWEPADDAASPRLFLLVPLDV